MVKTAETLTQSTGAKARNVCKCEFVCVGVFAYVLVCKQVSEDMMKIW